MFLVVERRGATESSLARIAECEAVVFDLDDTLYPERDYVRSGARAAARWVAGETGADPEQAARELEAAVQRTGRDPFGHWLRGRGLDPQTWLPRMLDCYRSHRPEITLAAGVERLLDGLARRRALALVTDGRLEQQRLKIRALRLERWPLAIVCSDEFGRENWKPSARPYRRALELVGVAAGKAVYVGDNPAKDFLGARRAGMLSIRFRRRGGLHAQREPSGAESAPDVETNRLDGLKQILTGPSVDDPVHSSRERTRI